MTEHKLWIVQLVLAGIAVVAVIAGVFAVLEAVAA